MPPANPFFEPWTTPFGAPPFENIKITHFMPAIEAGIAEQRREVAAISEEAGPPDFANVIEPFEMETPAFIAVEGRRR